MDYAQSNPGDEGEDKRRRKVKEADKVEVPPFPEINQLSPWRTKLMNNVAVASRNPDYSRVTQWLAETWSDTSFEQLGSSSGMELVTLDLKLASAMTAMMHTAGEKAKRFRDRVNLKMAGGDIIKGRQIVWMLLDSFKTFDRSSIIYGFDHLSALKVVDGDLHEFVIQWNYVLSNMGDVQMSTMLLRDAFYRNIEKVSELAYDLNQYERMHESDPRKS